MTDIIKKLEDAIQATELTAVLLPTLANILTVCQEEIYALRQQVKEARTDSHANIITLELMRKDRDLEKKIRKDAEAYREELIENVDAAINAAILTEREACAMICNNLGLGTDDFGMVVLAEYRQCRDAIRQRSNK